MRPLKLLAAWIQLAAMLIAVGLKNTYYRLTGQKTKIIDDA